MLVAQALVILVRKPSSVRTSAVVNKVNTKVKLSVLSLTSKHKLPPAASVGHKNTRLGCYLEKRFC